jgi:MPBQ/MSBQ methyltransferase
MDRNSMPLSEADRAEILAYLRSIYTNVFMEDAIFAHLENHVGFVFADFTVAVLKPKIPAGGRLLDMGSGFGSCVIAARDAGIDAVGIEISPFEVDFARRRLTMLRPTDDPQIIYREGDARKVDFAPESFDVITCWNVLEHIDDLNGVILTARRLLKTGGLLYIICPNYMAWRQEAHYHVPWKPNPLLPREHAVAYLTSLGKDPKFFETSIFRRTNWEVLSALKKYRFEPRQLNSLQPMGLRVRNLTAMLLHPLQFIDFYNPIRHSVVLAASKLD